MGYDRKFKYTWLNDDEEDPLCGKILKLVYAAIFDEHAVDSNVTLLLMEAYDRQVMFDREDKPAEDCLVGEAAETFCREEYVKVAGPLMARAGYPRTANDLEEVFTFPDSIPFDYPLRKKLLRTVAKRLALADTATHKAFCDYARVHFNDTGT